MKKWAIRILLSVTLLPIALGGLYLASSWLFYMRTLNPQNNTLKELYQQFGTDFSCAKNDEHPKVLVCIGPRAPGWMHSAGMPEYVFENGKLTRWTQDNGDAPPSYQSPFLWHEGKPLERDEALRLFSPTHEK